MLTSNDEHGFTLAELAVAMSLLLVVIGALLAALESGTSAERHASTRIDDEQSVRLVLAQFSRDVRNASATPPLLPIVRATKDEIDLTYANGWAVAWVYTPATGVLHRTVNGNASVSVGGLTNPDGTVFQVLAADGSNMFDPNVYATTSDITKCAVTVMASVTSRAHPPSKPFVETVNAPLDAPGVDRRGCP